MKRILLAGGVALATVIGGTGVGAVEPDDFRIVSTESLYRLCSAPPSSDLFAEARQACYGFIYGAGLFYYEIVKAGKAKSVVCPDDEIDREAVREAFVAWARSHPDAMNESPVDGLLRAAASHWPCPPVSAVDSREEKAK